MTRLPDWQSRLSRFLEESRGSTFAYGTWDCCMFVAGAIYAITGVDIAADYRGKYSDALGAAHVCKEACGRPDYTSMAEYVAERNNMLEVPRLMAQRGDMVATSECLGIVAMDGQHVMVIPESGFQLLGLEQIQRAWRVG